jgi:hypothetical protein
MTETAPRTDEVWRAKNGATRIICDAANDGYWVMYFRPAPAPREALTVLGCKWNEWVARESAVRISRTWRAA